MGPNLQDHVSLVFFLAFLLFSWTTASIMSGALIERVRLSAYLLLAVMLGSVVWILDAAWGWSSGGWLTTRFGFHDSIASGVVHGVAGAFTLGVLLNLGPRIGKYDVVGRARGVQTPQHPHDVDGADADLHRLLRLLRRLPGDPVDGLPRLAQHLPLPTTLGTIAMVITFGFAGGFTGGWFASKGDPFWTLSGGLAGVISVSAGADVYHPSLAYLLSFSRRHGVRLGRDLDREEAPDRRRGRRGRRARLLGFYGVFLVGIFAGGYPTGDQQHRQLVRRPADRAS